MIKGLKAWNEARKLEKRLIYCRLNGHTLERCGEMNEARMIGGAPVKQGPPVFWLFSCINKCGYGEVNDVGTRSPYARSYIEGERLKTQQGAQK